MHVCIKENGTKFRTLVTTKIMPMHLCICEKFKYVECILIILLNHANIFRERKMI